MFDFKRRSASAVLLAVILSLVGCDGEGDSDAKKPPPPPAILKKRMATGERSGVNVKGVESAEQEPNDSPQEASPLAWGDDPAATLSFEGLLEKGRADVDHFLITPPPGARFLFMRVTPKSPSHDVSVRLADLESFDLGGPGVIEQLPNASAPPEGMLLAISGEGNEDIPYLVELRRGEDARTLLEPDAEPENAGRLPATGGATGWLNHSKDVDWVRIDHAQGRAPLDLVLRPPGSAPVIFELVHLDRVFWRVRVEDGRDRRFDGLRPTSDPYFLRVEAAGTVVQPLPYTVTRALRRLTPGHLAEFEPNDNGEHAQALTLGAPIILDATLATPADVDHYRVELEASRDAAPRILTVRVTPARADGDVAFSSVIPQLAQDQRHDDGRAGEAEALCNMRVDEAITLDLAVTLAKPDAVAEESFEALGYALELSTRVAGEEEIEPNPIAATATPLTNARQGFIHPVGDVDVYRFEVPAMPEGRRAPVTLSVAAGYPANLSLALKDETFADISRMDQSLVGEAETLRADLAPGVYFVIVRAHALASCTRPYNLRLDLPVGVAPSGDPPPDDGGAPPSPIAPRNPLTDDDF